MELDDIFHKHGIRFFPTRERASSKNFITICNIDNSIVKTQYWKNIDLSEIVHFALNPVKILIRIRRYIAFKNCGAYEKQYSYIPEKKD